MYADRLGGSKKNAGIAGEGISLERERDSFGAGDSALRPASSHLDVRGGRPTVLGAVEASS
jgi:hypothetical protein